MLFLGLGYGRHDPSFNNIPNFTILKIAQAAYDAYNAGAAIVHLHARDKSGASSDDPKIFSEINTFVRAKSPIIIQNSIAPATRADTVVEKGIRLLTEAEVLPDMGSLDCTLICVKWKNTNQIYQWTRDFLLNTAKLKWQPDSA